MCLCGLPSSPAPLSSRNPSSNSNNRFQLLPPSPPSSQLVRRLLRLPCHRLHLPPSLPSISPHSLCLLQLLIISHDPALLPSPVTSHTLLHFHRPLPLPQIASTRAFLFTLHNDLFALVLILDDSSQKLMLHCPTSTWNS
jgi:hypothetical protein